MGLQGVNRRGLRCSQETLGGRKTVLDGSTWGRSDMGRLAFVGCREGCNVRAVRVIDWSEDEAKMV